MTKDSDSTTDAARLGRETAFRVLAEFERVRLVPAFVDAYVRQHNRRELKTSPLRYRELLVTLTRESLVAIAAKVSAELPRRFTGRRSPPTAAETEAIDAFTQAFIGALGSALRWTPGDLAEFARDVALYARMAAFAEPPAPSIAPRGMAAARIAKKSPLQLRSRDASRSAGPFADRCALLLDPSLLDKARAAAAELHAKLEAIATSTLSAVLRRRM